MVLIFGIVFATGVDVMQLGNKLLARGGAGGDAVAAEAGAPVEGSSSNFSMSITGPGGWKNAAILITVIFSITVVALSVLSSSGRDAAREKAREARLKEEQKGTPAAKTAAKAAAPAEEESEECNLASYKLFFRSSDQTASAGSSSAEKSTTEKPAPEKVSA